MTTLDMLQLVTSAGVEVVKASEMPNDPSQLVSKLQELEAAIGKLKTALLTVRDSLNDAYGLGVT